MHLKFKSFMFQICYRYIDPHHLLICCSLILSIYLLFICICRERERELFDQLCSVYIVTLALTMGPPKPTCLEGFLIYNNLGF